MACSAGRGKKYKKRTKTNYARVNKNRPWALIKTPVGEKVCVNGGGRGKETAAEVRLGSESKRQPGGARTETAGKGTGKEWRE